MAVFQPSFLVANDNTVVALKFIESMNLSRDVEEQVLDKLKDDVVLEIRTVGGVQYTVSSRHQMEILKQYCLSDDPIELRTAIFERWVNIVTNQDVK